MELTLSGDHINRCFTPEAEQQLNSRRVRCGRATRQVIDFTVFSKIDSLERSLPASVRWSIRKAAHEGIAVLSVGADSVEAAQALYVQTMREKGAPAYYGAERFRLLFRNSRSADIGCLYLAYQGQMAVGMAAVADSYTTRHLLQLAVPQRFRKSRVADLLIATALREAYVSGKRYFDFMATSRDDAGLTEFKAKWGGTTEDILHVVIPVNPLRSKLVDGLRQTSRILAASRLWRLMPRRICS